MKYLLVLLGIVLLSFGCKNGLETVETKDDFGYLIKYTRSKKDFAKEGLYVKLNPDGSKYEEAQYKADLLHGERKIYGESGNVEILENYLAGKFEGSYQQFYENGKLQLEGLYVNNLATGDWKKYYKSGQLMEIVAMKDNMENGRFIEYHENGNLKTEGTYLDGDNEHGELKLYNEAGKLIKKMNCERGICRTSWEKE